VAAEDPPPDGGRGNEIIAIFFIKVKIKKAYLIKKIKIKVK